MSYPGGNYSYPLSFRRHVPVRTEYVRNYGNTTSTGNTMSTGLTSTGASGYSGHSGWTGEPGTTSNLATTPRERDISGSQENSTLPITDPRNFSSSLYLSANHGHDKLPSKYSPASSPSPSDLRQEERDKPDPVDPRSSLRKLLDCAKELQDLDVEKCLHDYKIIKEAHDPTALTKEVRLMSTLYFNILFTVQLATLK